MATEQEIAMQRKEMARAGRELARHLTAQAMILLSIDPDLADPKVLEDVSPYYLQLAAFVAEVDCVVDEIRQIALPR